MTLRIVPTTVKAAKAWAWPPGEERKHRHHRPPRTALWAVAVADESGAVRGIALIEPPKARMLRDGGTVEVSRVCTDGARNACSMLLGAAWRAARALGYRRMVTYTLPDEGGASLRGAGWRKVHTTKGEDWDRPSRRRDPTRHPTCPKWRWEVSR